MTETQFWASVNFDGPEPPNMNSKCWVWTGSVSADGYGAAQAHRRAWTYTYGPIPSSRVVCHWCDNPACVRPDHLWLGTRELNLLDAMRKGRRRNSTLVKEKVA